MYTQPTELILDKLVLGQSLHTLLACKHNNTIQ